MRAIGKKSGLVSLQACKNHRIGGGEARGLEGQWQRRKEGERKGGDGTSSREDCRVGFLRGLPSGVGKPVVSQGSPNSCFSYCPSPQDEGEGRDGNSLGLPNPVIPSPPVALLASPLPQDSQRDGEQRHPIFRDSSCKPPPLFPAALFSQWQNPAHFSSRSSNSPFYTHSQLLVCVSNSK